MGHLRHGALVSVQVSVKKPWYWKANLMGWDNWDMGHSFLCMGASRWWEVNLVDWDNWDMGHSICEETLVLGRRT